MLSKLNPKNLVLAFMLAATVIAAGYWFSLKSQSGTTVMKTVQEVQPTPANLNSDYGKLPLSFEPNKGQTDPEVKFLARSHGYALFLTSNEAVLRYQHKQSTPNAASMLQMRLEGANANPRITGLAELPGKSNYFVGSDPQKWLTDIPTYGKVKYEEVYPGIDLMYYGTDQRQLEYDFVVAAGADPGLIRLSFAGMDHLEVDSQGDLVIDSEARQMRMNKPAIYQEKDGRKEQISGQYKLTNEHLVSFDIPNYDTTRDLVIDPVLVYSTFLGGTGEEFGIEIAVNAHGNAFVTGLTTSLNFPTKPINAKFGPGGGSDAFVTKFNPAGNQLIYSTYLGGTENENFYDNLEVPGVSYGGIALDSIGNAYVTGLTRSADFPHTAGVYQESLKGLSDTFVTKLNGSGNALLYSTFLGQNGVNAADGGQGIAVDSLGQAYVTGLDYTGGLPVSGFSGHATGCDGYVAKLNVNGTALLYSTYFGGSSCNLGWNIAVDKYQDAFVSGETSSTNFPTTVGALDTTCGTDGLCNGNDDFFITKVDTKLSGPSSLIYSTYLGGSGEERVTYNGSIAVNPTGELIYVTGLTASVDFPIENAAQPLPGGNADAFITKLDISLPLKVGADQIVYSTYLGGPGTEIGTGIAADVEGNAYVAGSSGGTFPSTQGMTGCIDPGAFVAKLNSLGVIQFATCISGLGQDTGLDIAVDPAGCAYVTGFTESNNYPIVNAFQPIFAGGTGVTPSDAFVTKICSGLDHFKCYDVRAEQSFIPFRVTLVDQFEREPVLIQRAVSLCNPVVKCVDDDHNPATPEVCTSIVNPDDHLVCYETRDDSGKPSFERQEVVVSNQFGQEQHLTVLRRQNVMCLPSLKAHVRQSP